MLQNLTYHLLPGRCPAGFSGVELHNTVFNYWKNFWDETLKGLDGTAANPAEFDRQSLIAVITDERRHVVGLSCASFFNFDSMAIHSHPYFMNGFETDYIETFRKHGYRHPMSIEYLTVNPAFRKSETGVSVAVVLIGLSMKLMERLEVDAATAPARLDLKVDAMARHFGALSLGPRVFHNVPVASLIIPAANHPQCPLPAERALIDDLWGRRAEWISLENFRVRKNQRQKQEAS